MIRTASWADLDWWLGFRWCDNRDVIFEAEVIRKWWNYTRITNIGQTCLLLKQWTWRRAFFDWTPAALAFYDLLSTKEKKWKEEPRQTHYFVFIRVWLRVLKRRVRWTNWFEPRWSLSLPLCPRNDALEQQCVPSPGFPWLEFTVTIPAYILDLGQSEPFVTLSDLRTASGVLSGG